MYISIIHYVVYFAFQLMAVHGTNTFLGIVNKTCDGIPAFCPCSMVNLSKNITLDV